VPEVRLHDGSPHDALTQKPFCIWARSAWVEQWAITVVTCDSRHAKRHAIALHFACMPDFGCRSLVGKRGDGGVREEGLCLTAVCMMGRRMTR